MSATIERLLEQVIGPPALTDTEVARALGLELPQLRLRLRDLKRRGILRQPVEQGEAVIWTSWFPTLAGTIEAGERSGLPRNSAVLLRRRWWGGWTEA